MASGIRPPPEGTILNKDGVTYVMSMGQPVPAAQDTGGRWVPKRNVEFAHDADMMRRIQQAQQKANAWNTGMIGGWTTLIPGTPSHNLEASIKPVTSSLTLGTIGGAKANGASLGQNPTDKDAEIYRTSVANLDVGQDTDQFKNELGVAERFFNQKTPGLTASNPLDLSQGQSRATVPRGAYYRDPQGNIRRNDNGDAGNPIFDGPGKPGAAPKARPAPQGIDPLIWGHMTPQEQALWK